MEPNENFKHLGLLAVAILTPGLAFVLHAWPLGKDKTFSQHVARRRSSILYYSLLFAVVLPLLVIFFIGWFVPTYGLSTWFSISIIISAVTQQACTMIPEIGGWRTPYHRVLAVAAAAALMPALVAILISDSVDYAAKTVAAASLLGMASIALVLARGKGEHSQILVLQAAYFGLFFMPVLMMAYVL